MRYFRQYFSSFVPIFLSTLWAFLSTLWALLLTLRALLPTLWVSSLGFVASASIIDPALSFSNKDSSQSISGFFKTRISRNIRVSESNFTNLDRQDGLLDNLYISQNLNLAYTLDSSVSFLKDTEAFFELNYRRPIYGSVEEIKRLCWNAVLCFGDTNLGLSKRILQVGNLNTESSIYLRVPFSKSAFDQSFLIGAGASLDTNYNLGFYTNFYLSVVSSHSGGWNFYFYETVNAQKTSYNVPLNIFNLLGLQLKFLKNPLLPTLFFYGSHSFALNSYNTPFHYTSLNTSASWILDKNIRIVVGLNWQDRIFKLQDTASSVSTTLFSSDHTFLSLSGSYSF